MPIDIQCTACGQRLRVGDALAGKQANCPKCKAKVNIPAAAVVNPLAKTTAAPSGAANPAATTAKAQVGTARVITATPVKSASPAAVPVMSTAAVPVMAAAPAKSTPAASADEWHLYTPDGQQYGPISKVELDAWLTEDRITADSQLLPPGGQQWVMATQVYPSLAQAVQPVTQQPVVQPQAPQFPSIAVPSVAPVQSVSAVGVPSFPPDSPAFAANPYASPTTSGAPQVEAGDDIGSLAIVRRLLIETRPWALFIAIVGFLYGALVVMAGIFYLGLAAMALGSSGGAVPAAVTGIISLAQLAVGALIIYCFVCLTSYAMRIGEFQHSMSVRTLEGALRAQRSFWRIAGILLAIILGLIVLGIVLVVAGGIGLGLQGSSRF